MNELNPLAKKLQIKPGKRWLLYNAPANYIELLQPLPENIIITLAIGGDIDGVQLFVNDAASLADGLALLEPILKPDTIFWITYPKKSSGINSGLEMMGSWDEVTRYGLRIVTSVSVNETWTALRFKPIEAVKQSETRNEEIKKNEYSDYIDVDNKQIILPADIKAMLEATPAAMGFYQGLSYSNRKEYLIWILSAKQEKTKAGRLEKMLEKLSAGKKNPAEK